MPTLCIDLGGSAVKTALVADGIVLASREFPVTGSDADLEIVRDAAEELRTVCGDADGIDRIGIAVPGVVDRDRGCLVKAHDKYGWAIGLDLCSWAEETFGAPAIIENDARAALAGEVASGCARGETDAVIVVLGTGIGTAALLNGRLLRGAHDHAGILGGHVTVDIDAPPCNCGNVGCAESLASSWALEQAIREHPDAAASPYWSARLPAGAPGLKDLIDAPHDDVRRDTLARFCRIWGAAIVSLCHAYDPDTVVVTGGVMRAGTEILPVLSDYVHRHLWSSSHRPPLLTPESPELSVVLGLAALASPTDPSERTTP